MKIKISFIIIALLLSFSSRTQNKASGCRVEESESAFTGNKRAELIRFAKKFLGTPYLYASSNPAKGFDCSGFVYHVYKNFKIKLPRSSGAFEGIGKALKPSEFRVGDVLVFYGFQEKTRIGHVGIICEAAGMKSRFIHSSSGKAYGVTISELGSDMYTRRFYKCVDVIN